MRHVTVLKEVIATVSSLKIFNLFRNVEAEIILVYRKKKMDSSTSPKRFVSFTVIIKYPVFH